MTFIQYFLLLFCMICFIYWFAKQVLIRLIGADESMYSNYAEAMQWLEDTNVLEMIVDKFSSSVCASVGIIHLL